MIFALENGADEKGRYWTKWKSIKQDKIILADGWLNMNPSLSPPMERLWGLHLRHRKLKATNYLFTDLHAESSDSLHLWVYVKSDIVSPSTNYIANNPASPWWPKQ